MQLNASANKDSRAQVVNTSVQAGHRLIRALVKASAFWLVEGKKGSSRNVSAERGMVVGHVSNRALLENPRNPRENPRENRLHASARVTAFPKRVR